MAVEADRDRGSSETSPTTRGAAEARYRGRSVLSGQDRSRDPARWPPTRPGDRIYLPDKFYPGPSQHDMYDIDYDDGERETRVAKRFIRKKRGSSRSRSRSRSRRPSRGSMRVGTRVEARYRGRSKKYPGKISRVHADGTFDVSYDDGESETRSRLASSRRSTAGQRLRPPK